MPAAVNDPMIAQSGMVRIWVQKGTANPTLQYAYMGCCQLEKMDQDLGKQNPVYCPSSSVRNQWDIVDVVPMTPALPTTAFTQHASRLLTDLWFQIKLTGCLFNVQAIFSKCARPDDRSSWDAIAMFGRSKLVKLGLPTLNLLDGAKNEVIDLTGDIEMQTFFTLYPMQWQQVANATAVAELVDGFYYDQVLCGDCGAPSDGCQKLYALQIANAGSPGLSSQVIYSSDGGNTFGKVDIPTLGGLSASRMAPMGIYDIVVSPNQGAYHYEKFTDIQSGLTNWVQVTSGFVAGKSPRCITVRDPQNGFIGAQGGVIYYLNNVGSAVTSLTDGTITSQDVNDIHYFGRSIVAVTNNNGVLYSQNNGQSWVLLTGPAVGFNLSAVWCLTAFSWFVAASNGKLYQTLNAGQSWTQVGTDVFNVIDDIQFYDENIGYMAVEIGGAARVYRTIDAGATWQYNTSAVSPLAGTVARINVVGPCGYNTCLAVGRASAGGAGVYEIAKNAT